MGNHKRGENAVTEIVETYFRDCLTKVIQMQGKYICIVLRTGRYKMICLWWWNFQLTNEMYARSIGCAFRISLLPLFFQMVYWIFSSNHLYMKAYYTKLYNVVMNGFTIIFNIERTFVSLARKKMWENILTNE